jgi:hypothetical protein
MTPFFEQITAYIKGGMSTTDALDKYARTFNQLSFEQVKTQYYREKRALVAAGTIDGGHGNAKLSELEELAILSTMRVFALERKAGSVATVLTALTATGLINRWQMPGGDNSKEALEARAKVWADSRVSVWRKKGFISKKRTSAVPPERQDVAQQLSDGKAFFAELKSIFDAQGYVVSDARQNFSRLTFCSRPTASSTSTSSSSASQTTRQSGPRSTAPSTRVRR